MIQFHDIRDGMPTQKKYEHMDRHPVEKIQEYKLFQEEELKLKGYAQSFGSHFPMKLMIERNNLAQSRRLPGLKSSFLGLKVHMNTLNKIEFEDFLGGTSYSLPKHDAHSLYEKSF